MRTRIRSDFNRYYAAPEHNVSQAGIIIALAIQFLGGAIPLAFGFSGQSLFWWVLGFAIGVVATGFPSFFRAPYAAWMLFAEALGWLNTRLILGILYFGIFTPVAAILKILGKDALARTFVSGAASYRTMVPSEKRTRPMEDPF